MANHSAGHKRKRLSLAIRCIPLIETIWYFACYFCLDSQLFWNVFLLQFHGFVQCAWNVQFCQMSIWIVLINFKPWTHIFGEKHLVRFVYADLDKQLCRFPHILKITINYFVKLHCEAQNTRWGYFLLFLSFSPRYW